jgi:Family of unknown function (DUF6174)
MRALALSAAALILPLGLVACGSGDDGDEVASDPAPTSATSSPTSSPTPSATPSATPTASPTVGTYPEFAPTDYTFQLSVSCFCLGAGAPIVVTVTGGEAVSAVYAQDGGGRGDVKAGDPADQNFWLTINDVIAQANNTDAEKVTVDWPDGQEYPNEVFVDQRKQVADDEIGYTIADVQVTG